MNIITDIKIGWWLDYPTTIFYHGTHKKNQEFIMSSGFQAPTTGPTKNWVSLALEPFTARGYASMSGESEFRAAGKKAVHVPMEDRVVFVIEVSQRYFMPKMAEARGMMDDERDKLINKKRYLDWKHRGKSDIEYYAMTEIRLPKLVPSELIIGVFHFK